MWIILRDKIAATVGEGRAYDVEMDVGVKLEDRRPSTELSKCLDVEPVADVVRRG